MASVNGHPLIIELVGVAGAGKTTLLKRLHEKDSRVIKMDTPPKSIYFRFLAHFYFTWVPFYLKNYASTRWFTQKEVKQIAYLETWLPYLRHRAIDEDIIAVLDPGSIFWLTALNYFGPPMTKSQKFVTWWDQMRARWMSAIDLAVWLDAPSELLADRVLSRDEWHECKGQLREEIVHDFDLYKKGYTDLMDKFPQSREKKWFHFETDKVTPDEIANKVFTYLAKF